MAKTKEDIERIHAIASELQQLGLPQKITDRIHRWANEDAKRLRDEARNGKAKEV
jgi:hypothetical protein